MTEQLVDASLTEWEDGIDLVLDVHVARPPVQVWPHLVTSELLEDWFVSYRIGDSDADGTAQIFLEMDDQSVPAHVLSFAAPEEDADDAHVLLDIDGVGRLGITLTPLTDAEAADAPVHTRLTLSHTIADRGIDHAVLAQVITEVGPVWETHLRLLAGMLTFSPGGHDVPESQLTARYEALAREIA